MICSMDDVHDDVLYLGMRCIVCNMFVVFPTANISTVSKVECPQCTRKFCVRCKTPWHGAGRCPLEVYDESVELWRSQSGAQKCPTCKKLIEKDGPDTCNHMIHKIVDAIPCIRERTDFCCKLSFVIIVLYGHHLIVIPSLDLCGEEVLPNYPHDEVKNPGVNHFPEGVFQKCRHIINKEKEEERERLRRQKRMRAKQLMLMSTTGGSSRQSSSVLPSDGLVWETSTVTSESYDWSSPPPSRQRRRNHQSPATSPSRVRNYSSDQEFELNYFDEEWGLALTQPDNEQS